MHSSVLECSFNCKKGDKMKYKNYYNHELGTSDIYTKSGIRGMTLDDILKNELSLAYQYNTIGIPDDDELTSSPNTSQYMDGNGKTRWRAGTSGSSVNGQSSLLTGTKTTADLLEEERLRAQAQQAQLQAVQSQLGSKAGNAAVSGGNMSEAMSAGSAGGSPQVIEEGTKQALNNFAAAAGKKWKDNRQKQKSPEVSPIGETADKIINTSEPQLEQSPIETAIDDAVHEKSDVPNVLGLEMPLPEEDFPKIGDEPEKEANILQKLNGGLKNLGENLKDFGHEVKNRIGSITDSKEERMIKSQNRDIEALKKYMEKYPEKYEVYDSEKKENVKIPQNKQIELERLGGYDVENSSMDLPEWQNININDWLYRKNKMRLPYEEYQESLLPKNQVVKKDLLNSNLDLYEYWLKRKNKKR